jgi:synapsin
MKRVNLLVVVSNHQFDWIEFFKGKTLKDIPIVVKQATWNDLVNVSYQEKKTTQSSVDVSIKPIKSSSFQQDAINSYKVDFILFRSVARGHYSQDARNFLFTFMHGAIPSVNSIESMWLNIEKPISYGLLNRIKQKVGFENFPLIPQTYWPIYTTMTFAPNPPYVLKYGGANAGYGKLLVESPKSELRDYAGLLAMTPLYCCCETFIKYDHEIRIQKIGKNYRALKRVSSYWKGNVGNASIVEECDMQEKWKNWIDWSSDEFGGLDICAMDVLVTKDGDEYILEINDTAIGLSNKLHDIDSGYIRDLVLERMEETLLVKDLSQKDQLKFEIEKLKAQQKETEKKIKQLESTLKKTK